MLQLLLNCLIIVACSGAVLAQDVQTISVQDLRDGKVVLMGRLGVPVGNPVEVKYVIPNEKEDGRSKGVITKRHEQSAKVLSIGGKPCEPAIEFKAIENYDWKKASKPEGTSAVVYEQLSLSGGVAGEIEGVPMQSQPFEKYSILHVVKDQKTLNDQSAFPSKEQAKIVSVSSILDGKVEIIGDLGVPFGTAASVKGTLVIEKTRPRTAQKFQAEEINGSTKDFVFDAVNPIQLSHHKVVDGYRGTFLAHECFWVSYNEELKKTTFHSVMILLREK